MREPETIAVTLHYVDAKGVATRRCVSPIKWLDQYRFMALCLCRQEPRQMVLSRCSEVAAIMASDVVMPVEITPVDQPS